MIEITADLSFGDMPGEVEISEREKICHLEYEAWNSIKLVDKDGDVNVSVFNSVTLGGDPVTMLAVKAFHIVNDDTKRGFHALLSVQFDRAQLRQLRDYLSFLLKSSRLE